MFNCRLCSYWEAGHPIGGVSSSPVFCDGKNVLKTNFAHRQFGTQKRTNIGNDVWIASKTNLKAGRNVFNGVVIGFESMVVCDIGPYEIWAGNFSTFIRKRFTDEIVLFLNSSEWREWNEISLRKDAKLFNDPKRLREELQGHNISRE